MFLKGIGETTFVWLTRKAPSITGTISDLKETYLSPHSAGHY